MINSALSLASDLGGRWRAVAMVVKRRIRGPFEGGRCCPAPIYQNVRAVLPNICLRINFEIEFFLM